MAVEMNKIVCPSDDCKFRSGCIVVKSVDDGARFSPILKLKLESIIWKLRCFSYVKEKENGRIFNL